MAKKETPIEIPTDDCFEFELGQEEKKVKLKAKDGTVTEYVLKEAMGGQSALWRDFIISKTKMDPKTGKATGFGAVSESEPYLVSLCLFKATGKKDNVTFAEVKSWPNRVIKPMFNWIKEVSDLDEGDEEEEAAKNEQADTPDGS